MSSNIRTDTNILKRIYGIHDGITKEKWNTFILESGRCKRVSTIAGQ